MLVSLFKSSLASILISSSLYTSLFVFDGIAVTNTIVHYPSLILVVGCLIGVSLFLLEWRDYPRFFSFLFTYSVGQERNRSSISESRFEEMLNLYIKEGPQSLSNFIKENNLPYIWQIVATKLEIKVPINDIKNILTYKIRQIVAKLDQDIVTLRQLSALAPAFGLLGTVLGLIRLLGNMTDFSSLGTNMSLALITTLYGIFLGNLVFVPIARQVEKRKHMGIKNHENIIYWLSALEDNKPSFYLKNKLRKITSDES
ncbi:MAG: MotA/TolQ/ExbB proton channel family protein [Oligoflexales bacterium]|nr:MotA/TolQ/ExbB proton channel family protein [Oligoflexales bacterium]